MQEEINQLKARVQQLENMLTLNGMPYSMREIIRNEVIKGEDSTVTLTQVYTDSGGDTITAGKAYNGTLIFRSYGKEYVVPTIAK